MKSLDVDKFFLWDKGITDTEAFLNIYDQKFSTVIGHQQSFTCPIDQSIQTGDIWYNPIDQQYWLVMYVASKDRIYKTGVMYRCSGTLKWKDRDARVWEYPVHDTNATQYNSGVDQGRIVDYGSSQHRLMTTTDENTLKLVLDQRFFVGESLAIPDIYKLTQIDTSAQHFDKGIISLTLTKDQYNALNDDIDQRLCDVRGEKNTESVGTRALALKFRSSPTIRTGGIKTIVAESASGNLTWAITTPEISDLVDLFPTDRECKIKVKLSSELIGKSFVLTCTDDSGEAVSQEFTITGGV
ncbi:MAG: hypothetical protein NC084_06230 [Bacteroides sp.]|nr:hypothetical protein [Bacteroides sp.]